MKTRIPPDFCVSPDHREYAVRKGWPLMLPDIYVADFKHTHEARETKHKNWDQAFKLWIWRNSPTGPYYHDVAWWRALEKAKEMEASKYKRLTQPQVVRSSAGYAEKATPMPANVRQIVERMRNGTR